MRFVISIVAALMILGLAVFGVVSAQKMSSAPSQATASNSAAASAPQAAPTAARRHPVNPVSQVSQSGAEAAPAASIRRQALRRQALRLLPLPHPCGWRRRPDDAGRSERRRGTAEAGAVGDRHSGVR